MPVREGWHVAEAARESGELSRQEAEDQILELERDCRDAAREAAAVAYDEELGRW